MKNEEICPYTVVINTSCDSSKFIRDQISISFGDAYGNQIFAPRLANPNPFEATFEQCSTNTFQINGSCAYQICYAYLKASGPDDWKPENVTINGPTTNSTSFNFSTIIPKDQWYGFNLCDDHHDDSSSHQVYTHTMFLYVLLLLGLLPICFWW
ncbi:embryo-specific protein ATS3B-like [Senna tora]|uniref:Embryo-specific protein ATS3B-like n=1 Tax=Senna tora TaxID=362788 RepID=A0A834W7L6_9FABA|nr:embryo-specific protein ATS3B-like [Senna tora]